MLKLTEEGMKRAGSAAMTVFVLLIISVAVIAPAIWSLQTQVNRATASATVAQLRAEQVAEDAEQVQRVLDSILELDEQELDALEGILKNPNLEHLLNVQTLRQNVIIIRDAVAKLGRSIDGLAHIIRVDNRDYHKMADDEQHQAILLNHVQAGKDVAESMSRIGQ